jgi:hypothetical protein
VPNIEPVDVADVCPDPSSAISAMVGLPNPSPSTAVKMMCEPSGVNVG